jgi:hypothetical protein
MAQRANHNERGDVQRVREDLGNVFRNLSDDGVRQVAQALIDAGLYVLPMKLVTDYFDRRNDNQPSGQFVGVGQTPVGVQGARTQNSERRTFAERRHVPHGKLHSEPLPATVPIDSRSPGETVAAFAERVGQTRFRAAIDREHRLHAAKIAATETIDRQQQGRLVR